MKKLLKKLKKTSKTKKNNNKRDLNERNEKKQHNPNHRVKTDSGKMKKKRSLIKSKRERRREKAQRDKNFDMFRGWFGDRDYRTKQGLVNASLVILSLVLVISGITLTISGFSNRQEYMRTNTTPAGEERTFSSSDAKLTFGGAWTDKNKDVTVVKLLYSKKALEQLSTKGSKYKLFIVDNQNKVQDKIKMSYGILGTKGDGYLVINGKLDKKAYQIVMTNQLNPVNTSSSTSDFSSSSSRSETERLADKADDITESQLEESLSETRPSDIEDDGTINFEKNSKKPSVDYIDFRVNSYSEKTKVIDDTLLKPDGSVDYAKMVSETSVKRKLNQIDREISVDKSDIKNMKEKKEEFDDRVKDNKDDDDAKSNAETLKKDIEKKEQELKNAKTLKAKYENKDFDKSDFGETQEKFKVIHSTD